MTSVRLFQMCVEPGQPVNNTQRICQAITQAKADGVDVLVLPEMAVPGYLLSDEWERTAFLKECEHCNQTIIEASTGITVLFGSVAMDWAHKNEDGRVRKFNALIAAEDGQALLHPVTLQPFFIKLLMPNYREFDDNRHFYDPRKLAHELNISIHDLVSPIPSQHGAIGGILCEDGWDDDYNISPLRLLKLKGAQWIFNISSSPYTFAKNNKRHRVFSEHAKTLGLPIGYVNCTGLQDNGKTLFTFDGGTCAYNIAGELITTAQSFCETFIDVNLKSTHIAPTDISAVPQDTIANQFEAITYGVKAFMNRMGLNKVVIGVSGDIDSALAAALYRHILPADQLLLVSMPGPYTSQTTRNLARQLALNLDCYFEEIPIAPSVDVTRKQFEQCRFEHLKSDTKQLNLSDFVLENIQARDRSSRILAGVAAAFGGAFTCNANKSEMTVGYSTLYGDLGGFLACLADLWKGEVYEMAAFINREVFAAPVIPEGTLTIVPSAELSAAQDVDQGKGDPLHYPYHDALFKSWVERWERATPEDILRWYLDGNLAAEINTPVEIDQLFPNAQAFIQDLERWWNLYQGMAVAKRIQAPPVIAVKRRAFGFDHRESQLGPRYTEGYKRLKQQMLKNGQQPFSHCQF